MNRISRISAALVAFLGIAAFILSYAALQATAEANGIGDKLSHLFPLIVDGFILVASLSVLRGSLYGEPTWYAWGLVIFFSALSVTFNVSHAPDKPLARVIAGVAPLALLLSFELLMSQLRLDIRRRGAIQTLADLMTKTKAVTTELTTVQAAVTTARDNLTVIDGQAKDRLAAIDGQIADRQAKILALNGEANDIAADITTGQETLASLESEIADAEKRRQAALDRLSVVRRASDDLAAVSDDSGKLSKADRQPLVLRLAREGLDAATIAGRLSVSERTIVRDLSELNGQVAHQ